MPTYNKLVRDRIPEIIAASGHTYDIEFLDSVTFDVALREKLIEESHEVATSKTLDDLTTELADVLEVLDAIIALHGLDINAVRKVQQKRRDERGAFETRVKLLSTKE